MTTVPLTYAQIVNLACQDAHVPGMTVLAGQKLNMVLSHLAQDRDVAAARGVYYFTFNPSLISVVNNNLLPGSGPYNLPADYLRCEDDDAFFMLDGVPYPLIPITLREMDNQVQQQGIQNYPRWFVTDVSVSPPVAYFYPPPFGAYPVTIRYFRQLPFVPSPELSNDFPWFPGQQYLVLRLTAEMMRTADDTREVTMLQEAGVALGDYLKREGDRMTVATIRMDPRRYGARWYNLPMSKTVG